MNKFLGILKKILYEFLGIPRFNLQGPGIHGVQPWEPIYSVCIGRYFSLTVDSIVFGFICIEFSCVDHATCSLNKVSQTVIVR